MGGAGGVAGGGTGRTRGEERTLWNKLVILSSLS